MLWCKNLHLEYIDGESKRVILDDINLEMNKGENIILVGPSGSGKSSLIYLLSTLRNPTSGKIFLDDIELTCQNNNKLTDIRKKRFAFVFQTHFLLPYLTTIENVLVAKNDYSKQSRQEAIELLTALGLGKHIDKKIHQMSGGERQRVAIARALITKPDVIFADEPTASLDHNTAKEVLDILKNYKEDSILIMATHDTSILSGDEKILRVQDGKVM